MWTDPSQSAKQHHAHSQDSKLPPSTSQMLVKFGWQISEQKYRFTIEWLVAGTLKTTRLSLKTYSHCIEHPLGHSL